MNFRPPAPLRRCLPNRPVGALLSAALTAACSTPFDASVQSLGRFSGCLRRLGDMCAAADGTCRSSATGALSVTLGRRDGGTFLWAPDVGGTTLTGRIVGRRFELVTSLDGVDLPCGCRGDVREVIRGELLVDTAAPECAAETSSAGCGNDTRVSTFFADGAPSVGWLDGADADPPSNVTGLRAWVTDTATPSAEGGCSCAACETTFEAVAGQ
jgi:hypothetical protein